jgi:hypothetical protein
MAQPAAVAQARELTRTIPFCAQKTFPTASLANNGTLVAEFDLATRVTDLNQFAAGGAPSGGTIIPAIGPFLDALAFSVVAGTILVEFAVDTGTSYRQIALVAVPANTATNISGLRVTGRFARVTYTNTSGGAGNTEFGAYIRST